MQIIELGNANVSNKNWPIFMILKMSSVNAGLPSSFKSASPGEFPHFDKAAEPSGQGQLQDIDYTFYNSYNTR